MQKTELIKILKPLVKQCIREVLLESDGVLAKVITETVNGLASANLDRRTSVLEQKNTKPNGSLYDSALLEVALGAGERKSAPKQHTRLEQQLEDNFRVNIFEGTTPLTDSNIPPPMPVPQAAKKIQEQLSVRHGFDVFADLSPLDE